MISKIFSKIYIPHYIYSNRCVNFSHRTDRYLYISIFSINMAKANKTRMVICPNGTLLILDFQLRITDIHNNPKYFRALKGFHKKPHSRGVIITPRGEVLRYQDKSTYSKKWNCIPHTNNNYSSLKNLPDRITIGQHFFKDGVASYLKVLCGGYKMV